MSGLSKLYSNSVIYAISSFIGKAIGFVMIPIYTRCLTPSDYGVIELMYRAADVASLVVAMGLGPAVTRFYFDYQEQKERNEVVSSGIIAILGFGAVLMVLISVFREQCSILLFGDTKLELLVQLAAISTLLDLAVIVPMAYVQAEQKSFYYAGVSLAKLMTGLAMNIWLVVCLRQGVIGVAYSAVISSLVSALLIFPMVVRRIGIRFSTEKTMEMFNYGLPMVPGQMAMFALSFSDRFILGRYAGTAELGTYSLGYKFGMLMNVLVAQPFFTAWVPYALSIAASRDCGRTYSDALRHFAAAAVGFALLISLMARDLVRLMADPAYISGYLVIAPICLGHVMRALANQIEIGILISKQTTFRLLTVGTSAILNVALNFALVPGYGAMGAAWAAGVSFTFFAVITYIVSNKLFSVSYDIWRVLGTVAVGVIIYAASTMVRIKSPALSIATNLGFLACFPIGLVVFGIWPRGEVRQISDAVTRLKQARVGAER